MTFSQLHNLNAAIKKILNRPVDYFSNVQRTTAYNDASIFIVVFDDIGNWHI